MRIVLLLVLMVCILAYVRAKQPATWNSWMSAIGVTSGGGALAVGDPRSSDDSPERTIPVGGLIKEGDFSSGGLNWEGDGGSGPGGKGVEVKLNPSAWTRVYQSFKGDQRALYSIEVTYRFSPGLTVSQNPSDYGDISHRINVPGFERYGSVGVAPGEFYGTIGDTTSKSITCEVYSPRFGTTEVQDYQHTYAPVPPNGNNVFALAFPPGTGTVTLLTAYVIGR